MKTVSLLFRRSFLHRISTPQAFHPRIWFLLACAGVLAQPARAATWSWSGGGGANAYWNNSANWGFAGTPGNGDTVIFVAGSPNALNTNNLASLTLNQIRFVGSTGGYDIRGNAFTLTNSIVATNITGGNTIENNLTLTTSDVQMVVSNGASLTLAGSISGSVGVNKTGLGTLTYQSPSDNYYTGTTLVSAGTLQFNVGSATAVLGPLVIGDGTGAGSPTVMDLQGTEMDGIGPVTIKLNGTLNLNNMNEPLGFNTNLTLSGGTIQTGSGTLTLSPNTTITSTIPATNSWSTYISGNLNTGSGTLTLQGGAALTVWAAVSGAANIVQTGPSLFWYGANTYTGNYTVNGYGYLLLGNSLALGNTNNTLTLNGQTLVYLFGNLSLTNRSLTINSTNSSATIYVFSGYTNSWGATNFTLSTACSIDVETNSALNLIGPITGSGGFTKTGAGTLTLSGSGANSYQGLTTVNAGELDLNKTSGAAIAPYGPGLVIGNGTNGIQTVRYLNNQQIYSVVTPVVVNNAATLNLNGFSDVVSPVTLNSGVVNTAGGQLGLYQVSASGASSINGTVLPEPLNISNGASLSINANILPYGSYGLTTTGVGTVYLMASNSFTGPTVVQQGCLEVENSWALGTTNSPAVVSNNATLVLAGGIYVTNKPLVLNGPGPGGVGGYGALDVESGINVWAGPVTNNANSTLDAWYSGSELHIAGPISGSGALVCFGSGSPGGTHFFEGAAANSYGGLTTVTNCTLLLNKSEDVQAVPGNLVVSGASSVARLGNYEQLADADVLVTSGGLFDFASFYDYINTLRGNGTVNFGVSGFLVVGDNNGTSEFDGTMTGTGYAGGYTVGKFGSGTFTLGGNNNFTAGATEVFTPGKLVVNGSEPLIPALVGSGGALGGTGAVGVVTANGIVSPGESPGILTCSNVNFSSTGNLTVLLAGPNPGSGYSQLNVTGTVSLASATLTVVPAFTVPPGIGQQFIIITNNGGTPVSGTFSGLANGSQLNAGGYYFRVNYNVGAGNDVVLTVLGVPQNTVTLNAVATGWYDSTGYHSSANANYAVGEDDLVSDTNLYRNFFVFNAPVFTGSIISAELIVNCYSNSSLYGQETYVLRQVTNSVAAVEAGGSGLTNIYNDLGDGPVYGVRTVSVNEGYQRAIIPLNLAFMNDLAAASGGQIALGGTIATLAPTNSHHQFLFAYSSSTVPGDVQLRVSFGTSLMVTNATSRGWYDSTGMHTAVNLNYIAGIDTNSSRSAFRNYFVFNLPVLFLSGQLVNAELWVNSYSNASPSGLNTYQLHDVTTPIATLTNNASGATNTYADLGTGALYGGRDVYVSEAGLRLGIPLNQTFLGAAQTNSGGQIALGGSVASLTPASSEEFLFAFSSGSVASDAQLWLGFLASPASSPSFAGGTPTYLGNNLYQFALKGTTGTTNEIQASFDFQNWDYITDVVMPGATATFYYTNNVAVPYRFFQARLLP